MNELHRRAICIDLHADTVQRIIDEDFDISQRHEDGHLDAPRMREGGLDAQFFSIWVEPEHFGTGGPAAVERADKQIAAVRSLPERYPDTWELATTAADVRRIVAAGKLAALMGLEGGYAIDEKLENVKKYYDLGVRYMSGAWSVSTSWAGSSNDKAGQTRGLNDFGRAVIQEMNALGMMVDVSHVSDKTFWDIIETSDKPVIASHSNARALANHPRNLTDEQIRAVGERGGVMCAVFYNGFLDDDWSREKDRVDAEIAPLLAELAARTDGSPLQKYLATEPVRMRLLAERTTPLPLARVVDHIDHIVKLAGVECVGIGSDYDGIPATPNGLDDVSQLPNLTAELLRRGYTPADVEKILGGNVLRVLAATHQE
jgi:membrane dipeptidase